MHGRVRQEGMENEHLLEMRGLKLDGTRKYLPGRRSHHPRRYGREEKTKKIQAMIEEIKAILSRGETEIYVLGEFHFSTESYLVRGWFKKKMAATK